VPGLDEDRARHPEQQQRVGQRGEDLGAVIAVRLGRRRRARGEPRGDQGEGERGGVGQHVARVGQQGEAARPQAGDELDDHHGAGQREGDDEHRPRARGGGAAIVIVHDHRRDRIRSMRAAGC